MTDDVVWTADAEADLHRLDAAAAAPGPPVWSALAPHADQSERPSAGAPTALVERVVDGDTIIVEGVGSVRLIGVDTPETVHPNRPVEFFGKEASAFTKRLLEGKQVRLEYDQERQVEASLGN